MIFFEIKFQPLNDVSIEDFYYDDNEDDYYLDDDDFWDDDFDEDREPTGIINQYLELLFHNGQIMGDYTAVNSKGNLVAYVNCPEPKALLVKNHSMTAKYLLLKIKKHFEVSNKQLGVNLAYENDCCNCAEPSFYILDGSMKQHESPVICGDCENPVPLYRLPCKNEQTLHTELIAWHNTYSGLIDMAEAGLAPIGVIEKELNDVNSPAIQWGLDYCRTLAKYSKKQAYLHVEHKEGNVTTKCPKCGKIWRYIKFAKDREADTTENARDSKTGILTADFGAEYEWCVCDRCGIIMDMD